MSHNNKVNHMIHNTYDKLIAGAILFVAIIIWTLLKRWCFRAKIRRRGEDFPKVCEHIHKLKKGLNGVQRFLLEQTGIVVDKSVISWFAIPVVIVFMVSFVLSICMEDEVNAVMEKIKIPSLFILFAFELVELCHSVYELIKYARVLPFVFWALICAWYIWIAIPAFC